MNVAVDSTQGTDVVIRSGLQAGQQVVTDGQEKLQEGSRVIPRPSTDAQAARQARAAATSNPDPNANAFSNGRSSDLDPAAARGGTQHPRGAAGDPNGTAGLHAGKRDRGAGATGATPDASGHRRRPETTNP